MKQNLFILASAIILVLTLFSTQLTKQQKFVAYAEAKPMVATDKAGKEDHFKLVDQEKSANDVTVVNWKMVEETATKMVADSDQRFKKSWAVYMINEADAKGINPYIVYELLKVETGHTFSPDLVGPKTIYGHAYGMSQFMENTAPWIAEMAGLPYEKEMLFDPYYAIKLSVTYLDHLYGEFGNWDEALTAYHRGIAGMKNYKTKNGTARSEYARVIQTKANTHDAVAIAN